MGRGLARSGVVWSDIHLQLAAAAAAAAAAATAAAAAAAAVTVAVAVAAAVAAELVAADDPNHRSTCSNAIRATTERSGVMQLHYRQRNADVKKQRIG